MDQLTDSDKQAFAQAVAEDHPEWARTDANGNITNVDRVLRNWRVEAVNQTHLDNGSTVSVYNAATREYAVGLHPGAQFSLEYSADGYPELHLNGTEQSGNYRILDEALVRHITPSGETEFMPADEVPPTLAPEPAPAPTPEPATPLTADTDLGLDNATADIDVSEQVAGRGDIVVDTGETVLTRPDAPVERIDIPTPESEVAAQAVVEATPPVEPVPPPSVDANGRVDTGNVGIEGSPQEDVAEPAPEAVSTNRLERIVTRNGSLEFEYDDSGELTGRINASIRLVSDRMSGTALAEPNEMFLATDDATTRNISMVHSRVSGGLRQMYMYDQVMDTMADQGQEGTPEYDLLRGMYRRQMEQVASAKGMPVEEVFRSDILREYGYEVPDAPTPSDETAPRPPAEPSVEPREAPEVAPDVAPAPTVDSSLLQQVTRDVVDYSDSHAATVQMWLNEYEAGRRDWDSMSTDEQSAFTQRVRRMEDDFREIAAREASRR